MSSTVERYVQLDLFAAEAKMLRDIDSLEQYLRATPAEIVAAIGRRAAPVARRRDRFPNDGSRYASSGIYRMHTSAPGLRTAVSRCLRALRPIQDTFDAIFVTGQSGIVPGAACAWVLKKELIILRKEGESSHGQMVEGASHACEGLNYIMLDDFIANGGTLTKLLRAAPPTGKMIALCLYGHPRSKSECTSKFTHEMHYDTDPFNPAAPKYVVTVKRQGPNSLLHDLTWTKCD